MYPEKLQFWKAVTPRSATGAPILTEGKLVDIHVLHDLSQSVLSKDTQVRLEMLHKESLLAALNNIKLLAEPYRNTVAREAQDQPTVAPLAASP